MQLSLIPAKPLSPLPTGSGHYVAAVQNKKGELGALQAASPETWQRMTPLIHVVGPLQKRPDPIPYSTVRNWMKKVHDAVGGHPVYLDLMRLAPGFPVATTGGEKPVLGQIYRAARRRGLSFVPVLPIGETTKKHLELVKDAVAEDGHGVALRFRYLGLALPPGSTRASLLNDAIESLGCAISDADLLVDLAYLDPDEDFDASSLAASIREMLQVGPWRCVVLLGSSIPKMLSCITEGTVGSLPRREWELWTELASCDLPRLPAFGDYAVQHPHPPSDGGPGMRANIRYTARGETIVARGKGDVRVEGSEQYRGLCQELVARTEFSGADYTWGDEIISACARGALEPGAQNMWRGAGTSHHLRFVTDQLRELHPVTS